MTEPQPPTLSEAERDVLSAINASHGQEVMFDRVDHLLAARHEQATQEADRRVAEVVAAVEAVLDDADQLVDTFERPNCIKVWAVRRTLMRFGGRPHRWQVPAEFCAECGHYVFDHDPEAVDGCNRPDCDCLLSRREAQWGRDEEMDDAITAALWEEGVAEGEGWAVDAPFRSEVTGGGDG